MTNPSTLPPPASDEVRLTLPAAPQLLRVARLTAAGLAGRLGFTYDEVEDIRIAVDELCFILVGSRERPGTITLIYTLENDALAIQGIGQYDGDVPDVEPSEFSQRILDAVVDEHDVHRDGDVIRFTLRKHRTAE